MAISLEMPNREQAIGISNSEPPATPDAPQAASVDNTLKNSAVGKSTAIPIVCTAASVIMEIVMAAPSILIVAPSGIDTEYISLSSPSFSHNAILTGIFAAELLVKNAVRPLSRIQRNTKGYGLHRKEIATTMGLITSAAINIQDTSNATSFP